MVEHLILQFSTSEDVPANWMSAAIRRCNHSPFSHINAKLPKSDQWPEGSLLGASDEGAHGVVIEGNPRGVAIRPPDYHRFGIRREMILRTDKADAIIAALTQDLGKPFDSTSLWGFFSDEFPWDALRNWRNPDSWFCAEHKVCRMEDAGYWPYPLPWPKNRVSPTDILLLLLMDERWVNRDTFWHPIPGLKLDPGER